MGAGTEELMRFGEQQLDVDAAMRQGLEEQVAELAPTIERGRAAREELGGRSLDQVAADEQARLRAPLAEQMAAAEQTAAVAKREVEASRQAIASAGAENVAALRGFHDAQQILAGHEDAALAHAYDADDAIKRAKANVEHFKTNAPKRRPTNKVDEVAQSYLDWINDTEKFLGSDMPQASKDLMTVALNDATGRVMPNGKIIGGFQQIDRKIGNGEQFIKNVKNGKIVEVMKDQMRSGYVAYKSKMTGEDLAISADLDRMIKNLNKSFEEPGKLGKAMDTYTQFFKTYATMTPGFHSATRCRPCS